MGIAVIDTGTASAARNMEIDGEMLGSFGPDPVLRFYEFEGRSATYGHFIKPETLFCPAGVAKWDLRLAKRPTGGGVIFHLTDFTFSLFVPSTHPWYSENTLTSYRNVNEAVIRSLGGGFALLPDAEESPRGRSFCMAHPTKYDILFKGKKVGGAAQRRVGGGFLHQASLLLTHPPYDLVEEVLLGGQALASAMRASSSPLLSDEGDAASFRLFLKENLLSESKLIC